MANRVTRYWKNKAVLITGASSGLCWSLPTSLYLKLAHKNMHLSRSAKPE